MSAADPAHPTPPTVNGRDGAAVIDFSQRHTARTTRGRWEPVGHPGRDREDPPAPGGGAAQQLTAEHFELTFNEHGLTLSDDETAKAYRVTLLIVAGILKGAQAQGIIDEGQRGELDALLEGMMSAPDLV